MHGIAPKIPYLKSEDAYAIYHDKHGFFWLYRGAIAKKRKHAIKMFCDWRGINWKQAQKEGYRTIKIKLNPVYCGKQINKKRRFTK